MNRELALQLTDTRLLQTLRLLETSMKDHPDQYGVANAVQVIHASRDFITRLRGLPESGGQCCA